jgi:hypothetical protein
MLGLALLFVAAPAPAADEAVYIWRDSAGVVRFSPVPQPEVEPEPVNASPVNLTREPPQGVTVSDAKGGRPY